ncbi:MAG: hypothetical protein IT377_25935 [Polyangiaceae bacterium]|nr:hypothetical protein [Myxococcales bacterium]MCC6902439.1 hypothetical protein [Polyangiaceae bacterium]
MQPHHPGAFQPPGPPGGFLPPVPGGAVQDTHALAKSQVAGPAIALMIASGCACLFYLFATVMVVFAGGMSFMGTGDVGSAAGMGVASLMYLFWALMSGLCFAGALRMKAMKNYGLAMTSAVVAVIPCTTYVCCMLMMPFGIWALIVLMKPEVKSAFT